MKLGLAYANALNWMPADAIRLGKVAEESGYDSLWTVEHVVLPQDFKSEYPYSQDGKMPGGDQAVIPDPLVWLSFMAGVTSSIKLCTGILILPQRNPVILAKETATLDQLSNGRLVLGVGVGWLKEEFDALGVEFESRAKRTDECISALRALWSEDSASYKGEYINFELLKSNPKPVEKSGIPIVIGGHSSAAAKRAGRLGDGFFPAINDTEVLKELVATMRKEALSCGRNPDEIEVTFGGSFDAETLKLYGDLGVSRVVIPPYGRDAESLKTFLGNFREVVEKAVGSE